MWIKFDDWLKYQVNLDEYNNLFQKNQIKSLNLMNSAMINNEYLIHLGIKKQGHRLRILYEINQLETQPHVYMKKSLSPRKMTSPLPRSHSHSPVR